MDGARRSLEQPTSLEFALVDAQVAVAAASARWGLPTGREATRRLASLAVERDLVPHEPAPAEVAAQVGTVVDGSTFSRDLTEAVDQLVATEGAASLSRLVTGGSGGSSARRRAHLRAAWLDLVPRSPAAARLLRRAGWLDDARLYAVQKRQGIDPSQVYSEITGLADLARRTGARSLLEIGTSLAGTFVFLANALPPGSEVVTMDLTPCPSTGTARKMIPSASRPELLAGDSTEPANIARVHDRWPGGFDLMLIDGDHTYEGVRADTLAYADLVRPGGILAFHDIVPSIEDRFGIRTGAWVGGVPAWWQEVRAVVPEGFEVHELVESWEQDGRGIGALVIPRDAGAISAFREALARTPTAPTA